MSETSGWSLVAMSGLTNGASYPLTEAGIQLGRADECELVLPSQNVSRKHARVFMYQGHPYVQDLGSRNGVFVNGVRVQQQGLQAGDTLAMGEFVFQVVSGSSPVKKTGSRRGTLYGGAALLVVVLLAAAALKGGSSSSTARPVIPPTQAAPPGTGVGGMLEGLENSAKKSPAEAPKTDASATAAAGGQGTQAISVADRRNQVVREYLDRAQLLQDAGKLTEAKEQYERALTLDPTCQLCLTRRERIEKEIAGLVQRHLDDGMKAFKALRYDEAISSWELVMNLSPDPGSQPHQLASRYIEDAKAKLESQKY